MELAYLIGIFNIYYLNALKHVNRPLMSLYHLPNKYSVYYSDWHKLIRCWVVTSVLSVVRTTLCCIYRISNRCIA